MRSRSDGFKDCRTRLDARVRIYSLVNQQVRLLKGGLRLRQVTTRDGERPSDHILTSRSDLPAAQVAYPMFDRWRQQNFLKYLRVECALGALVNYVTTDDGNREVPNPAWAAAEANGHGQASAPLDRLPAECGVEAWTNLERQRRTSADLNGTGKTGQRLWDAWETVQRLKRRRVTIPDRVRL